MATRRAEQAALVFRDRIAEDFTLSNGTFVSVGTPRPRLHPDDVHRCDAGGVPDDGLRADLVALLTVDPCPAQVVRRSRPGGWDFRAVGHTRVPRTCYMDLDSRNVEVDTSCASIS